MKYLYCWLATIFICSSATAQFRFGPLVGLNISNYFQTINGKNQHNHVKVGGRVGVLFEKPLSEKVFFQPGLNVVTNGYKYVSSAVDVVYIVHTLELPVNFEYKLGDSCSNHWFVGGGPYGAWNFGGRLHLKSGYNVESVRDLYIGPAISDDIRRWDVGFGLNGGYEFAKALIIRVHAQMGFLNLQPVHKDENKLRNYNFGLSVAYFVYRGRNHEKHRTREYDDELKLDTKEKTK